MRSITLMLFLYFNLYGSEISKTLFENNCLACHSIKIELSAPSVVEFKSIYMDLFPKKSDFIDFMSRWVYEPDEHTAFMYDAIQKYGLMPELGYDLDMLRDIAEYIYDTDFSKEN